MARYKVLGMGTLGLTLLFIQWLGMQFDEPRLGIHVLISFIVFTMIQIAIIYFFGENK